MSSKNKSETFYDWLFGSLVFYVLPFALASWIEYKQYYPIKFTKLLYANTRFKNSGYTHFFSLVTIIGVAFALIILGAKYSFIKIRQEKTKQL